MEQPSSNQAPSSRRPGTTFGTPVGRFGVVATVGSFLALATLVLYVLVKLWPHPTPSGAPAATATASPDSGPRVAAAADTADTADTTRRVLLQAGDSGTRAASPPLQAAADSAGSLWCDQRIRARSYPLAPPDSLRDPECVSLFRRAFPIWAEQRLLVLTLLSGILGGLIHALRSLGWYVGNRRLVASWIPYYLLLPITGGLIAVAFYLVVRGGFFSPTGSFRDTSPLGFSAMAVLVGMFSTPAALKLQQVAESLFAKPREGVDPAPRQDVEAPPADVASTRAAADNEGERGDLPPTAANAETTFG